MRHFWALAEEQQRLIKPLIEKKTRKVWELTLPIDRLTVKTLEVAREPEMEPSNETSTKPLSEQITEPTVESTIKLVS